MITASCILISTYEITMNERFNMINLKARTMLAQNRDIQQLSQAWKISVPPFGSFQKAGAKLQHLAFDSS